MKRLLVIVGAALLASLLSVGVSKAAIFDFVEEAKPANMGEMGGQPLTFSDGGITVDARGYWSGAVGPDPSAAYLDHGGGLGVCHTGLTITLQCVISSDDNVTSGETLELTFDKIVTISSISFRDAIHSTSMFGVPDSLILKVDGALTGLGGLDLASWAAYSGVTGTVFEFINVDEEFYIDTLTVTAIPLPPAIALFGAALFGLNWLGRRRRQSN